MTTTPRGSPELAASQAVPETTVNEQIRRTEGGAGRYPIADRVTDPPGSCADGAQYIIIATATGAFAGKEGQIAQAVGTNAASGWNYRTLGTIDEGIVAYVQDEDAEYKWSGSAWGSYGGSGYAPGGTDVALADGGTGASLADPNADRILFWDDSAGAVTWLTAGTNLTITGTTISASGGAGLSDGDYGDITVGGTGTTMTIDNDAVTFAKMQNSSAASKLLGRGSASGAGDFEEITLGTNLSMSGTTLNATGGGSGDSWQLQWSPLMNEPPTSNPATIDTRNSRPCLDFDTTTQETAVFSGVLPADYAGGGVTVHLYVAMTSATSGTVGFDLAFERTDVSSLDIDADSFGSATTVTATTVPGTSGQVLKLSTNVSNGANMDSLAAGELFRLRVRRDVANDTAAGDAELLFVMMVEQ